MTLTLTRWHRDESLADVWEESTEDYLAELAAHNEALAARRALAFGRIAEYGTEEDEREALVEFDMAACDEWLDSAASRDYDIEQEVSS